MKSLYTATAAAALMLTGTAAFAQSDTGAQEQQRSRQQERLNSIFGALFGDRTGSTQSIEAQWQFGRTPLATQRAQFEARVDADIRSGQIDRRTGDRLKSDYYDLVQLEARYGADRRFTVQEREDLAERYARLTQVIADGAYGDEYESDIGISVADGQAEFNQRVDASVSARRITRVTIFIPGWKRSMRGSATWPRPVAAARCRPRVCVWMPSPARCPRAACPPAPRRSFASSTRT